ncbi:dienelactone hydrolase [Sediminicola sp. YIK13]|uniref:alpha/beta hydrolase family protein n=1 Tax=Sediminicola sp. YIK13 TaxID=1453352 RepID=UPI00072042D9|nr:dienelactone hydrolase [Sediminicola sp. YIK13]ALM07185.1 dienelactone hydrolase [Sediminicola sp. YIK13]
MRPRLLANKHNILLIFFTGIFISAGPIVFGQDTDEFIYGDALPDAPELAVRGEYKVGVRTLDFVNPKQIDILNAKEGIAPLYDRPLKIEVWYPALLDGNTPEVVVYDQVMGSSNDEKRPLIPFTFKGRAAKDASPLSKDGPFPLVIVSHGYLGSRLLLTYLTENLASKGYIVVAIDHKDSTFKDAGGFQSTLLNRPKDILFTLNKIDEFNEPKSGSFLSGLIDVNNTAIIGYSMGGYGVLNVAGAGYSEQLKIFFGTMTGGNTAITSLISNDLEFVGGKDPRIKAVVAFAPWGMERGVWDLEGLKGLKTPTFFIAGDQDDISGYEKGIKAIFSGSVNADRYLLTYANARHNVAPNPPPVESLQGDLHIDEYYRYAEPSWDSRRMNNINQHFVTAFIGLHLKAKKDYAKYLNLQENSNGQDWFGFVLRSSTGMELLHKMPGE